MIDSWPPWQGFFVTFLFLRMLLLAMFSCQRENPIFHVFITEGDGSDFHLEIWPVCTVSVVTQECYTLVLTYFLSSVDYSVYQYYQHEINEFFATMPPIKLLIIEFSPTVDVSGKSFRNSLSFLFSNMAEGNEGCSSALRVFLFSVGWSQGYLPIGQFSLADPLQTFAVQHFRPLPSLVCALPRASGLAHWVSSRHCYQSPGILCSWFVQEECGQSCQLVLITI